MFDMFRTANGDALKMKQMLLAQQWKKESEEWAAARPYITEIFDAAYKSDVEKTPKPLIRMSPEHPAAACIRTLNNGRAPAKIAGMTVLWDPAAEKILYVHDEYGSRDEG